MSRAPDALTRREDEVVGLACRGMQSKEIARKLGITYNTVKVHLKNARRKAGARNAASLAAWYCGREK